MFTGGLPSFLKESAHADDRLAERTNVPPSVLHNLRRDIKSAPIPFGTHHVTLEDGSYAVLKDVSRGGAKRHVVATVLGPGMSPPGTDVTEAVMKETPATSSRVYSAAGSHAKEQGGSHVERRVFRDKDELTARAGMERSERLRDRIKNVREKSSRSVSRSPNSFSESYSFSSQTGEKSAELQKVAVTGALIGAAVAGGDAKQRAAGAAGGQIGTSTIGNLSMVGGLYAAHKMGYTQPIMKDTAWKTFKHVAANPIQSMKALGAKGGAIVAVPTVVGTLAGGYIGGKVGANKYIEARDALARRREARSNLKGV